MKGRVIDSCRVECTKKYKSSTIKQYGDIESDYGMSAVRILSLPLCSLSCAFV